MSPWFVRVFFLIPARGRYQFFLVHLSLYLSSMSGLAVRHGVRKWCQNKRMTMQLSSTMDMQKIEVNKSQVLQHTMYVSNKISNNFHFRLSRFLNSSSIVVSTVTRRFHAIMQFDRRHYSRPSLRFICGCEKEKMLVLSVNGWIC